MAAMNKNMQIVLRSLLEGTIVIVVTALGAPLLPAAIAVEVPAVGITTAQAIAAGVGVYLANLTSANIKALK